jgi:hypothetical protein
MAETTFGVRYQGPALKDGRMPVRDLAPALLALGDLIKEASAELYPDLPAPTLEIQATERGSFDVHLILSAPEVWEQVMDILTAKGPTALSNLQAVLLGSSTTGLGIYKLIKLIKRRNIKTIETTDDPNKLKVVIDDDTVIEAPAGTVKLYRNPKARKAARDSVAPAKRRGVDCVELRSESPEHETLMIEAAEAEEFDLPTGAEDENLVDDVREAMVAVVKADFGEGRWRLDDGTATFGAVMDDEGFQDRVNRGEAFRKGDFLRCRIRTVQSTRKGKLHNEHRIIDVIDHIESGEQLIMGHGKETADG